MQSCTLLHDLLCFSQLIHEILKSFEFYSLFPYCKAAGVSAVFFDFVGSGFHVVLALTSSTQPSLSQRRRVWMNLHTSVSQYSGSPGCHEKSIER